MSIRKKPDIFILHGWSIADNNLAKWQVFRDKLSELGVKSEFIPLPGLDTKLQKPWQLSDYVAHVLAILPKNERVVLLGHSFGGQIAVRLASKNPAKVAGLILIASAGLRDQSLLAKTKRLLFSSIAKVGKNLGLRSTLLQQVFHKLTRASDYHQADSIMKQTMRNVLADEVRADLSTCRVPVQLIWGAQDKVTPLWMAKYLQKHLPNSFLTIVDDARHSPQFTHAQIVAKLVAGFVRKKDTN